MDDAIKGLGCNQASFPSNRLPKLIDLLALEVGDPAKANQFKRMVEQELNAWEQHMDTAAQSAR